MVCVCFKQNFEEFEKISTVFESQRPLVIFSLNILLNIEELWEKYWFCSSNRERCLNCQFRKVYFDESLFQFEIYEHCFDLDFLFKFYDHFTYNLERLIKETDSHFVCELINKFFLYKNKCFFNGVTAPLSIEEASNFYEKNYIDFILKNDFKIIVKDFKK